MGRKDQEKEGKRGRKIRKGVGKKRRIRKKRRRRRTWGKRGLSRNGLVLKSAAGITD